MVTKTQFMASKNRGAVTVESGADWREYWGASGPLPAGSIPLGTVLRGEDAGVLLRMQTGIYVLGIEGALKSLDQRKVAAALSDAPRASRGRPAGDGATGLVRKNVTLDDVTIARLREIGGGDLSLGIRRAAEIASR